MIDNYPIDYCRNAITGAYVEDKSENETNNTEKTSTNNEDIYVYVSDENIANF